MPLPRFIRFACLVLAASACAACMARDVGLEGGRLVVELPERTRESDAAWERYEEEFERGMELLKVELLDPTVITAVRAANVAHEELALDEMFNLDARWQDAADDDPLVRSVSEAECSAKLRRFQQTFGEFVEIFVTDAKGLNVCQTNKTTDYYQADESWWRQTRSSGESSHGPIEYDQSASSYAVSVYVPVKDPDTRAAIGVAKGVLRKTASSLD